LASELPIDPIPQAVKDFIPEQVTDIIPTQKASVGDDEISVTIQDFVESHSRKNSGMDFFVDEDYGELKNDGVEKLLQEASAVLQEDESSALPTRNDIVRDLNLDLDDLIPQLEEQHENILSSPDSNEVKRRQEERSQPIRTGEVLQTADAAAESDVTIPKTDLARKNSIEIVIPEVNLDRYTLDNQGDDVIPWIATVYMLS
jgi:hypothetical protein